MSKTFVFIHGAWHGGWVWQRSAELARKDGYEAFTPSLTGLGDRAHLLEPGINLTTHVGDIVNLIESYELSEVVLCGHSYGGLVAGQVADQLPDIIKGIVFVDAFVPENGKSVLDLSEGHPVRDAIIESTLEHGHGVYVPSPGAAPFQMLDEDDTKWVDRHLSAQPFASFTERAPLTEKWNTGRRLAYVAATRLEAPMQKLRDMAHALNGCEYFELPCGHNIMVDMPKELHKILIDQWS